VELASGRRALGVGAAVAPMGGQLPQEMAERHPAAKLVERPLGGLTKPPAGAQPSAALVAEEPFGAPPEARCRRDRRTCCRPETPYDISGIQLARIAEHSPERRQDSPPGGASRNGRTLPHSQGSHSRTSRMRYSVQFLHGLFR
jgi:hypothetical protein